MENQRCAKPTAQKLRMTPLFPCSVLSHAFTCFHNFKKRDEKNIERRNSRDQISSARFNQVQPGIKAPTVPCTVPPSPPLDNAMRSSSKSWTPTRSRSKTFHAQPTSQGQNRMLPDAAGCYRMLPDAEMMIDI